MESLNLSTHVVNVLISNQSRKQLANQRTPPSNSKHAFAKLRVDENKRIGYKFNDVQEDMLHTTNIWLRRQAMLDAGLQTQEATKQHFSTLNQT